MIEITIKCNSTDDAMKELTKIHNNLKGNQDYINDNIVLCDRLAKGANSVEVIIFDECTTELDLVSIKKSE